MSDLLHAAGLSKRGSGFLLRLTTVLPRALKSQKFAYNSAETHISEWQRERLISILGELVPRRGTWGVAYLV